MDNTLAFIDHMQKVPNFNANGVTLYDVEGTHKYLTLPELYEHWCKQNNKLKAGTSTAN